MLDLSAAFDTISHKLLINHLKYHFGIIDTILQWIFSYLTNRSQWVIVCNELGNVAELSRKPLEQGIPQGSTQFSNMASSGLNKMFILTILYKHKSVSVNMCLLIFFFFFLVADVLPYYRMMLCLG